jgi:type IV secretion system protein VirB9
MKACIFLASVLSFAATNMVLAAVTPTPYPQDNRILHVGYQDNNVVSMQAQTFISTQLVFGVDERILDVEGGDRAGWMVTYQKNLPNMLFVKPTQLDSDSNITVVTSRHTYYFHVTSNKQLHNHDKIPYAIKFVYPNDARLQLKATLDAQHRHRALTAKKGQPLKIYNWNYSFNGSNDIMPLHVFDDGVFTYFEIRANQPMPAVFIVDNKHGEEAVVNIRRQGNLLVVHRTAPQFTLRMGKNQVASVFNNVEIARLSGRRTA